MSRSKRNWDFLVDYWAQYQEGNMSSAKGQKGEPGANGIDTTREANAFKGQKGLQGLTGSIGVTGPVGDKGAKGNFGENGGKGQKGQTGIGTAGLKGKKGDAGLQGLAVKGQKGDQGSSGSKGQKGSSSNANISDCVWNQDFVPSSNNSCSIGSSENSIQNIYCSDTAKLFFGDSADNLCMVDGCLEVNKQVTLHASWDGSLSTFTWAEGEIASLGISNVTRSSSGTFDVTFSKPMASENYTVTASAGDQNYSGLNASPRAANVFNRTTTGFRVVVERTDDAVNDNCGYIAVIIMGLTA